MELHITNIIMTTFINYTYYNIYLSFKNNEPD